ncbi:sugar ABC transporter permease [Clostridium sp. NSJ-49]|uniref:Carbohydrate uptake ABC transporter permease n=1 Tax=Clostridium disporicum TaxID=84024 RepID=A0A174JAT5_9CLOT|nr:MULTISPECIES: sugar ABC transporter permease [Clostridium]MBC5626138.1 sugar ABC transporter permease [Clostridium sp. NSJ-49]MCD2500523.1 sugar ABC transporter permease [Clostridium sp. NSJ-145]MDU6339995.1 sugar ABC transporter permease [Clostridium sp.]CUO94239.1 carbohydrate uptake ABC transporter permease [Clostridium disporicum]
MLKKNYKGYLYLLPALIILGVFVFYPIINTIIFSFDETKASGFKFGFGSYKYLFTDKRFLTSLFNTVIYAAIVPIISVVISLLLANTLVNLKSEKIRGMFQSIYFLPYVTSLVAIGIVWSWLFNSEYGVINYLLSFIGINPINWLGNPKWAMTALIIFAVWKSLAFNTLILTTGIASINPQYYQAAKLDQASKGTIFREITVKLVSPIIAYTYMISLIAGFKVYTEVYVLFGGRTLDGAVSTVVRYIIDRFYGDQDFPLAFAAAVVLLIVILTVTMVQRVVSRNKIHY